MQELLATAAPHAEAIVATREGRRRATRDVVANFEHIPADCSPTRSAARRAAPQATR